MKIIRDGKEIELTKEEMIDAYVEQERQWDMERITQLIDRHERLQKLQELKNDSELLMDVAIIYRENIDSSYDEDEECFFLMEANDYIYMTRALMAQEEAGNSELSDGDVLTRR